jgi:hypothetical protein
MGKGISRRSLLLIVSTVLLVFVGSFNSVFAQAANPSTSSTTPLKSDSIAVAKKEKHFLGFLGRMFHNPVKKEKKDSSKAVSKGQDTTHKSFKIPSPPLLAFNKGGISWTSLYTQGVNLNTEVTGMYQLAQLDQGFSLYGVPLIAEGTGVMDNGQFMKDYSSYSVNLDTRAFLGMLENRAKNAEQSKLASDRSHLPNGQKMNLADSMKSFDSIRAKLVSPSYQSEIYAAQQRFKKLEDSLSRTEEKHIKDSAGKDENAVKKSENDSLKKEQGRNKGSDSLSKSKSVDTTELHSLRMKIAAYEKLEKRYNELFEIKKNYNKLSQPDSLEKSYTNKYSSDKNQYNNPDYVKNVLSHNKMLAPYEKFIMGFQYFKIGRITEEMSDFTLHNFMMNGVSIGYRVNNIYVSGGYGNEQAIINPYLITGVNVPTYHRTVEYASVGFGAPDKSNLYATVISISDPGSINTLQENNWIFDLTKKIVIAKNFDIEGELAHSFFKYLPNKADTSEPPITALNNNDIAYAIKTHGIIPGINTDVAAQFLQVGENYVSLGNQFLLSGTSTYRAQLKQRISRKISLELSGAHIVQNQSNLTGMQGTDNWIAAGIKYKPTGSVDLEFNYSPRQLQQQMGTVVANSLTNNIDQMSFTGNVKNKIFGLDLLNTVFIGNFQYTTPEAATYLIQNLNLTYYMLNEMLMLTGKSGINVTINESRNEWAGDLSQFIGQATYNETIGKSFMFSSGGQWIEQPGVINNAAGIIGSVGKVFGKWGRLSLQLNCRNDINNLFDFNTGQIIISTNASILW